MAGARLEDFGANSRFRRVLPEAFDLAPDDKIRRVVLCSGKVYYDLLQARIDAGIEDVAILRIEQLYPWPKDTVMAQIGRYKNAEIVWCQEEPANMGPWTFVDRRLEFVLEDLRHKARKVTYAGRPAAASPATGLYKKHNQEQALLVDQALNQPLDKILQPFRRPTPMAAITPR